MILSALRGLKGRLFRNFLSVATLQAINFLVPLILIPYLLHRLGPSNFGLLMFAQAFAQILVLIVGYGHDFSATREISIHRNDVKALSKIFWTTLTLRAILLTCVLIVAAVVVLGVPRFRIHWPLYFIMFLSPVGAAISPTWFYQGMEEVRHLTGINLVARIVALACIFAFVHSENDFAWAAFFESARCAVAGLAALAFVWRFAPLRFVKPTLSALRYSFREGWHFFVTTLCSAVYTCSTVLLLGLLAGNAAVGFYSLAEKPVRAAIALSTLPMSFVVFPRISSIVHRSAHEAAGFLRGLLCVAGGGAFILSFAIFLTRGPLLRLIFGANAAPSIDVLGYLAWLPFLSIITNIFAIQIMAPFGMSRLISRILMAAAILHVLLLVPLARCIGAEGAAIAVLLTELFMPMCMGIILVKKGLLPILNDQTSLFCEKTS